MKVQGSKYPDLIWIKTINNGLATVRLRKNITETTDEEGNTIYEYDEVEVRLANRDNLTQYIENNFDAIFEQGLINEQKPNEPTEQERISALEDVIQNLLGV